MNRVKWLTGCEFCDDLASDCSVCHDTFDLATADCPHGEENATWYYRYANHEADTLTVKYDCGRCGLLGVIARVDRLDPEERAWNDKCAALREVFPHSWGAEVDRLQRQVPS